VRAQRNRSVRSAVKTKITKFRRGAAEGTESAAELVTVAVAALDRAVAKGVLHRNNAARRKSRLVKRFNALAQPAETAATAGRGSRAKAAASKAGAGKAAAAKKPRTTRAAKPKS
jgi:small subunit ribosomal protein S20